MRIRLALLSLLALGLMPLGARTAATAPVDAQVGQTRTTWNKQGTSLRQTPASLGAVVATLPAGTAVRVVEVRLPWLNVQAPQGLGWVLALDTIEPSALGANTPPPAGGGSGGVSSRDVSAVGRQFDASIERGYRQRYSNLEVGYAHVDELERATAQLDPMDAVAFIIEGRLGRRGRDFDRPARLPPSPRPKARAASRSRPSRPSNPLGGPLGGLLKDKIKDKLDVDGDLLDAAVTGLSELGAYHEEISKRFNPDQEYYLGRAVAATAIAKYGVDPDPRRREYVRLIGEVIVRVSERVPANRGGYHFEVLNSDEVNAVSGPGGFVLITRGAVEACASEDELAGILAHELAHVTKKHGEATLRNSKSFQTGLQALGRTATAALGLDDDRVLGPLLDLFDKAVGESARISMEASYGKDLELEPDAEGTHLLADVFYDPHALRSLLARNMGTHGGRGSHTHDAPAVRAGRLGGILGRFASVQIPPFARASRDERFARWMGRAAPTPAPSPVPVPR